LLKVEDVSAAGCKNNALNETKENRQEAVSALQAILDRSSPVNWNDYKWIIRLCEQAGNEVGKKEWYEKWFLAYPDFELFKQNTDLIAHDADKEAKIQQWIDIMRKQRHFTLVIGICLFLDNPEKAWTEFMRHKDQISMNEPLLLRLFKEMKKHDPSKLIPLYQELTLENIGYRKRSGYAKAARWMKELKKVCELSCQEKAWVAFYNQIMREYRRFRALMEEIRAAGIG